MFVTGVAAYQYVTVAYSAATGAQVWVASYSGAGDDVNIARSVAVSPDGASVYVTGQVQGATSENYATVAYNASTGAQLWAARYASPEDGFSNATAVTVSRTGVRVFVTGTRQGTTTGLDYATIAYRG